MKKLLFISNEASFTGAPLFLLQYVRYLREHRANYAIAVFVAKPGELVEILTEEKVQVYLSTKRSVSRSIFIAIWFRFLHYFRYLNVLRRYKPDLIYSNTIVNSGEVILAQLFGISTLLHMHEGRNFARAYRYRLIISTYFAKQIIVGSHYVNSVLHDLTGLLGIVIYNGMKLHNKPIKKIRIKTIKLDIGVLGTIDQNKGQIVAIKAMKLLIAKGYDISLRIAGQVVDEIYNEQLHSYIEQNNLDHCVKFLGKVPSSNDFLDSLDILLVPSYDEALPTVILEAFLSGSVVIASNVGGIPEIIDHLQNGMLVTAGDIAMLANSIEEIYLDEHLKLKLQAGAHAKLRLNFDADTTNANLVTHLDRILA
jgi:glycosyltransferase involved in cell wall biosynthesis